MGRLPNKLLLRGEKMEVNQSSLFDAKESEKRKTEGMAFAACKGKSDLELLRECAWISAKASRFKETTSDKAWEVARKMYPFLEPGPWAGSLFKGPEWVFTGRRVKSTRKSNHSREIKVWKLI